MGSESNEISLVDLWRILVEQKKIVIFAWAVCVGLGVGYAFLLTPIYKAEVFILPPGKSEIQALGLMESKMESKMESGWVEDGFMYQTSEVYSLFVQALKSRSNRREFYEEHQVAQNLGFQAGFDEDVFFEERFNKNLQVIRDTQKQATGLVVVSFEGEDPILSALWANDFVDGTIMKVTRDLIASVQRRVHIRKLKVSDAIAGKIQFAKLRRSDRIKALREALTIASSLEDKDSRLQQGLFAVVNELPLYMRGASSLKAEMQVLEAREEDTPFIEGLRDLQELLVRLQQTEVISTNVKPALIDQRAFVSATSIKPRKTLIIVLSGLLGLLVGLLAAAIGRTL